MKKVFFVALLFSIQILAQGTGEPFFFETANGAKYIHITGHRLIWQNPDSTIYNSIYFSEDSNLVLQLDPSVILFNGFPSTVYDTIYLSNVEPLQWNKKYYWRIVEFYNSSNIESPLLNFKTMPYPWCDELLFVDDFETGLGNWTITNDGGTCIWEMYSLPYPNNYTIPPSSYGTTVLSADADYCGNGTTLLSTATLVQPIYLSQQGICIIEFDNDWQAFDSTSFGFIEISEDQTSWTIVKIYDHIDIRNTHEMLDISSFIDLLGPIYIRFRSVQPGWHWWWVIDNFSVVQYCPITQFYPPYNLKLNLVTEDNPKVELSWSRGQFADLFNIYRKNGLPSDTTEYSIIGSVNPSITTFIDTTVQSGTTYTYRVFFMNGGSSNEATTYLQSILPVELTSFTSSINENAVTLNWQTATETNNSGFQIERRKTKDERSDKWNAIGFVNGNGTTTEQQTYSFIDKNLQAGKYQYRLKQIDFDGTFEYSSTIEVEINSPTNFSLSQNYPNPFNPNTNIQYAISSRQYVTLKVYDVLGKEVATLVNEEKPAGSYEVEFQSSVGSPQLASGIYYYQLKTVDFIATKKMILLK